MSRKIILINNLKTTKIVLLVCGLSASSGFIAVNMRKSIKRKLVLDYKIQVCREAEFGDYADQIAALMLGFLLKDGVWCD